MDSRIKYPLYSPLTGLRYRIADSDRGPALECRVTGNLIEQTAVDAAGVVWKRRAGRPWKMQLTTPELVAELRRLMESPPVEQPKRKRAPMAAAEFTITLDATGVPLDDRAALNDYVKRCVDTFNAAAGGVHVRIL